MLVKQEVNSEIKNEYCTPKIKFDEKGAVISFNIDNVPFCVVFTKPKIHSDGK